MVSLLEQIGSNTLGIEYELWIWQGLLFSSAISNRWGTLEAVFFQLDGTSVHP